MKNFKERIFSVIKNIPYGKVMSYGQVASEAGFPRAARQVGWILAGSAESENLPWWRVLNNSGTISIKNNEHSAIEQKAKLESEGIKISKDFKLKIEDYRYIPTTQQINIQNIDEEIEKELQNLI